MLSPAKINLTLKIGPRLSNGYHKLESLMVPLKWGDEISFNIKQSSTTKISVRAPGLKLKQTENLAFKAAQRFSEVFGVSFDLRIKIKKKKNHEHKRGPAAYLLWGADDNLIDAPHRGKAPPNISAPKLALPGHGESYNPPDVSLPT